MSEDELFKSKSPKLQPETDRGGSGRPPRKTAIGYFAEGEDDDSHKKQPNLRFGQKMVVRTVASVIGGYRVQIRDTSVEALLKTDKSFSINILLAVVFKEFTSSGMAIFVLTNKEKENFVEGKPVLRQFHSEKIDTSLLKYKRRSDTLPVSFGSAYKQVDFEELNIRRFIESISEPKFNGWVKFSSQQLLARGFLVILDGKCVGAEYRCASETFDRSTEGSILSLLDNLAVEDAVVEMNRVEREVSFALSIPFLGCFDSWHLKLDTENFIQIILDWFQFGASKSGMVCFQSEKGSAWAGFSQGKFIGFFDIESQSLKYKIEFLANYIEQARELEMQTFVLPEILSRSTNGSGFELAHFL